MLLKVKTIDIVTGKKSVLLNEKDAKALDVRVHDRVSISKGGKTTVALVEITHTFVNPGEVGVFRDLVDDLSIVEGEELEVVPARTPSSVLYIKKKMRGGTLSRDEIYSIVRDVVNHALSELELAAFLLAEEYLGMSMEETEHLTRAMAETGAMLDFGELVVDKHSIGGVPGNKVSLLIVPIVAAAGLKIPKTSSRAITSPAGTADTMEVLAPVEFSAEEVKRMVRRVGGCIVWGGALNIAPADDVFIRVEYPLGIDPRPQMLASILAKKLAVGAKVVVLDIPTGKEAKVESMEEARRLAQEFVELGRRLGMNIRCGITYGGQPVGYAVGPALEAKEALEALHGKGPLSLIEKSVALAGLLMEEARIVPRGSGSQVARDILQSGKALSKMKEIIEAQGGNPEISPEDIPVGDKHIVITSPIDGYITSISNYAIRSIARAAGAPVDKGAGVLLHVKAGHVVKKDQPIMEIFAERSVKLAEAQSLFYTLKPVVIEGMLLDEFPSY